MKETDEKELIKSAQKGSAEAFEALVNRHYETMYKMAFKWCGNPGDAEDITQEACIKLARGLDGFRHDSAFTSWLYRLVINTGKDFYRKEKRQPVWSQDMEKAATESTSDEKVYAREVLREVYKLPEGERDALILVLSDGLSHGEAARILGCKESTISWRIHEARKKLGALFEKEQKYG